MFDTANILVIRIHMGRRGPISAIAFQPTAQPTRGIGDAPDHVLIGAKRYYEQLRRQLGERLEPEDADLVGQAATALYEIFLSNVELITNGYVTEKQQGPTTSPWIQVRKLAHAEFRAAAQKLGLSPADRHRMVGAAQAGELVGGPSDFDKEHGADSA